MSRDLIKYKIYMKKYLEDNKDKIRIQNAKRGKKYRNLNFLKIKNYMKKYWKNNKKQLAEKKREYYLKNIVSFRKAHTIYMRNRRKYDINFKLLCNLRKRIGDALKNICKSKKTIELLGCTVDFFRKYYESKFTEGMTWMKVMNGEIHIDHIRPCASFDLSKPEEQHKCFHYTNLQPLWKKDNLEKRAKI